MSLQINPDPLRIVARKALATITELSAEVRCQAITKQGYQCTRIQTSDSDYCRQHERAG